MNSETQIGQRLIEQRQRLADAARGAGRDPADIRLIAVSKKHGADAILSAYAAGQRDFGENYVQELLVKAKQLSQYADIRWHLIGHLQTNKARHVVDIVHTIHTVSSPRLAAELGKRVRQRTRTLAESPEAARKRASGVLESLPPMSLQPLTVLVEVNVSGEVSKSGCHPSELADVCAAIESEPGLSLRGLMTMPPQHPDPERARPHFDHLRKLRDEHGGTLRLPMLSMGMSHDMHVAVEAGATMVRVGSAIFGERPN